jgi:hypothetical protein
MTAKCTNCGDSAQIDYDATKGETWCLTCGRRVDTNIFISEIAFQNNKAVGTWVRDGLLRGKF